MEKLHVAIRLVLALDLVDDANHRTARSRYHPDSSLAVAPPVGETPTDGPRFMN